MKKIIFGIIFLLLIGICIDLYYTDSDSQEFQKYIITHINNKNESIIDLKETLPFEWEKFYIFGPYKSKEEMYNEVGFKWVTFEIMTEGYYKVVFVNKSKVVCDTDISTGTFRIEAKSYPVYSSNSKFKLQWIDDKYLVLKQVLN